MQHLIVQSIFFLFFFGVFPIFPKNSAESDNNLLYKLIITVLIAALNVVIWTFVLPLLMPFWVPFMPGVVLVLVLFVGMAANWLAIFLMGRVIPGMITVGEPAYVGCISFVMTFVGIILQ